MTRLLFLLALAAMPLPTFAASPDADAILASGKFEEGIAELEAHLKSGPKDDKVRFGLGAVQLVSSVQKLGQKMAVYGPQARVAFFANSTTAKVPAPTEPLTYARLREINQE